MVPWLGFPYAVVYYEQQDRYAGQPKYTWRKSLKLAQHGLFSFSTAPLTAITLISIGVLAQYIGMIFEQVKNRPLYTLKQKRLASQQPPEEGNDQ